jgi:hypothetical protein
MARGNITQSDFGGGYYEARRKRGAERFHGDGGLLASVDRACTRWLREKGERFDTLRDLVHASAQEGLAKKQRVRKVPDKIESIASDLEGSWES